MKIKDQLYQRESVILRPRVVLKSNSQSGSQDLLVQEARSAWESQQDAECYGQTRSNTADHRIPGRSISTVKLQDARLHNNVESQKLLDDLNQTEIFELCENSAKLQCLDCNALSDIGIIYCSCGRNLKYKLRL